VAQIAEFCLLLEIDEEVWKEARVLGELLKKEPGLKTRGRRLVRRQRYGLCSTFEGRGTGWASNEWFEKVSLLRGGDHGRGGEVSLLS